MRSGFSSIIIIVILIAVAAVSVLAYSSFNKTSVPKSDTPAKEVALEEELGKYETEVFVFYYPKSLVINTTRSNPNILASYTKNEAYADMGYGINLSSRKGKRELQTDQSCKDSAIDKTKADVNKTKALISKAINTDKFYGCEVKYSNSFEDASVADAIVFYYKWLQNKNDDTYYTASALYFESESESFKGNLDNALAQFTLK